MLSSWIFFLTLKVHLCPAKEQQILGPNETPTDFLNRLKEAATKYTDINPDTTEWGKHLVYLFVGQASDDIRGKLQKLKGVQDMSKLLEVAWTVFLDRDSSDKGKPCPRKKGSQEKSSKKASPPRDKDTCLLQEERALEG